MANYKETISFLEQLGLSRADLQTFTGRMKIQKIVYLMKCFGIDLHYGYNWHWHGPYSPQLTHTMFSADVGELTGRKDLTKDELERLNKMRNFLGADLFSVSSLELVGSLLYLIKHGREMGLENKRQLLSFLREKKPQFSTAEIEAAWNKIERSGLVLEGLSNLRQ